MSAGTYLRVIRERRDISRSDVAKKIHASVQTVANIENGEKEPRGSLLFAFVDAVGASVEDVKRLMLARENENEAYRAADRWLANYADQEVGKAVNGMDISDARRLADRLDDPVFLAEFIRNVYERGRQKQ